MNIAACLSVGRLTFTATTQIAKTVFAALDIPLEWVAGGCWEQGLATMWSNRIKDGYDWVFTMDQDTGFDKADVKELCRLVEEYPEVDALCGTQIRRGSNDALMVPYRHRQGEERVKVPSDPNALTRLRIAHFGLTLIRLAALQELPSPWFMSSTGPKGRVDPDIYFWKKWGRAGYTIYQANDVLLGHAQLVMTYPTRDRGIFNQYMGQYIRDGKPEQLRTPCI